MDQNQPPYQSNGNRSGEQGPQGYGAPPTGDGPAGFYGAGQSPYGAPPQQPAYADGQSYHGVGYGPPPLPPKKAKRRHTPLHIALLAVSVALLLLVGMVLITLVTLSSQLGGLFRAGSYNANAPSGTFSVVQVVGNLQSMGSDALGISDPSYHHADTLAYIRALTEDDGNTGILLYLNTPGGGVYESDELYRALQTYQKETGRPVWAYMADTCASGGYYACAGADYIMANRNTITGSLGVYIAMTDTSGLYEKLGIETVLVKSGANKGVGTSGVPITDDQRAVYQSLVDEYYGVFVDIVADGRNLSRADTLALADGRVYSARQALENGLVDELGDWNDILAAFEEETDSRAFYPSFSRKTGLGSILGSFFAQLPENEVQTQLALAERYPTGVPMALYDPT